MNEKQPTHSRKESPVADTPGGGGGGESGSWRVSSVTPRPSRRVSSVVQLTALVTVTLLAIISILLAIGYQRGRRILQEQIQARLEAVAASRRDFVQEWVGRQRDRVDIFATRGVLRNFLEKHVAGKPEEPQRTQSQENLDGHVRLGAALSVCIVAREGRVLLSTDPVEVGRDLARDPVFQAGLHEASVGLPEREGARFVARLAAPTRWIDGTKETIGVVLLTVDVTPLAEKLCDTTGLGETGEVLLGVRRNGGIEYILPPRTRGDTSIIPLANMPAMVAATGGREPLSRLAQEGGEPIFAVGEPIGYGGWGLVVKMDEREAWAPIKKARATAFRLGALACLLGLLGAYTIARNFTRPIRRLARAARAVAAGNLSVSVAVRSWNEMGTLTDTFNEMVAALHARTQQWEKADAEIKTERGLLRSLIDLLPACIYVKDRESRFLAANEICAKSMGVASPLELIGKSDADYYSAELAAAFRADEEGVLEGRSVLDKEEGFLWSDGQRHIVLTTKVPRRDAAGEIIGIVGIGLDITERKRVEAALRASEALLRSITDHTEDLIFVKDRELRTIFMNPAGLRANAQTPERVLGHRNAEFNADPTQAAKFLADDRQVLQSRRSLTVEESLTSAKGETRVLLTTKAPRFDAAGEVTGLVGVARDITARKQASEALRESEARWRFSLQAAGLGAWELNLLDHTVWRSPRHDQIFGYAELLPEWTYEHFLQHVIEEDRAEVDRHFQRAVAEHQDWKFQCRIRRADGEVRWIWAHGKAFGDGEGRLTRMFGLVEDVTERKQTEEQIQASLHEKEVLLREVHHRVKNNLQIVSSLLALQSRRLTDPVLLDVFASTRDRVRAMASVHERLYESGGFGEIELSVHIRRLVRTLSHAYSPVGVSLQPVLQLEPVMVDLNIAVPLSLIANELIINALKYGFAGGRNGTLTVGLRIDGAHHELRIADDGPGFPKAIDLATTRTLGLRLVRDLARQIRGELVIDSDDSGTRVAIRWPARIAASEPAATFPHKMDPDI